MKTYILISTYLLILFSTIAKANPDIQATLNKQNDILKILVPEATPTTLIPNQPSHTLTGIYPNKNKAFLIQFAGNTVKQFTECSIQNKEILKKPIMTGIDQNTSFCLSVTNPLCDKIEKSLSETDNILTFLNNAKTCKLKHNENQVCKTITTTLESLKTSLDDSAFKAMAQDNAYLLANKFSEKQRKQQEEISITYELEPPDSKLKGLIPFDSGIQFLPSDSKLVPKYTMLNYVEMCARLQQTKQTATPQSESAPTVKKGAAQ